MRPAVSAALALLLGLAVPAGCAVFIVRHAEKDLHVKEDPPLTGQGRKRAQELARVLRSLALKAVYVTEFKRTHQTAQPTADEFKLIPEELKAGDDEALLKKLRERPQDDVLVVGHSDTIPGLLKELGVADGPKDELSSKDYDNMFVVDLASASAKLHWLHYGAQNP